MNTDPLFFLESISSYVLKNPIDPNDPDPVKIAMKRRHEEWTKIKQDFMHQILMTPTCTKGRLHELLQNPQHKE
jgi:hypothetical protein